MNSVFTALCGAINFVPPWIMLGVFGAIVLLIVIFIAFKGFKRGVKFIVLGLIIMAGAYLAYLGVQIALWEDVGEQIDFAVRWVPTILFVLIVMTATFVNAKRGLRKSLILAIHAVCAGALSVLLFIILVGVKEVDSGILSFVNLFLGGDGGLQRSLGVDESLTTFKEVLAAYIPTLIGVEGLDAYVYTLVDMAYRIVIAAFSLLFYYATVFILYIVYLLCYSQRKYKKNRIAEFRNGVSDRSYKKHHIGGGVVGLVRGMAVGLLTLSFLGSVFFVAAGGKGEGKLEDHDFGDEQVNFYYQIYRSVEGYGSQGIFKILNAMSDASNTPYYLFAADLIFSGELNDEELDASGNFKLREEIANFTGFARETFGLLMKYGSDELDSIVCGEVTDEAFDTVLAVMQKEGFAEEFNAVIDSFDENSYIINLSMAFVNVIVNNIDDISFTKDALGEEEREIIKLVFKKGYLDENIPDERDLIASTGNTEAAGDDIRPYLTVKHLINKNDVKTVLSVVLSMLSDGNSGDTLQIVQRLLPEISKLSILSTQRKSELNPVLGRLYCLVENLYLTEEGEDGVTYAEINEEGVDWVGEINTLLEVAQGGITLYNNVFADGGEALEIVEKLFDNGDKNYSENMRVYDEVCDYLTKSRLIGRALSTSFVYNTLCDALRGVADGIYIPDEINFGNTTDEQGNVVYGEIYQLFKGVKILFSEHKDDLEEVMRLADEADIYGMLNILTNIIGLPEDGESLSGCLINSAILRSLISIELIAAGNSGNMFYIPKAALEKTDAGYINLITKEELSTLFAHMSDLVRFVEPFEGTSTDWEGTVDDFINDPDFYELVQTCRIFEGTVAQLLNAKLGSVLTVPAALRGNIDGWITIDGVQGELLNLIDALKSASFEVSDILSVTGGGNFEAATVLEKIGEMTEGDLETFFGSSILHYTVSDYILNGVNGEDVNLGDGFAIVVPLTARQTVSGEVVVKKKELITVFMEISNLGVTSDDGIDITSLLVKLAKDKDILARSQILSASIVASMVQDGSISDDLLSMPEALKKAGTAEELKYFDGTNPWSTELTALIDALDELLKLSDGGELNKDDIEAKVSGLLKSVNDGTTDLTVLYGSLVIRNKITVEIDGAISGKNLVDDEVLSYVKPDGYYTLKEVRALVAAADALGIEDMGSIADLDYETAVTVEKLHTVYSSDIVKGIVTKNLYNAISSHTDANGERDLFDHELAYEEYLRVYTEQEIEVALKVFGSLGADEINYDDVADLIYDRETGKTKSYIVVATVTHTLLYGDCFVVPDANTVYDAETGLIRTREIVNLIDAFNAIKDDYDGFENITDFGPTTNIRIPKDTDTVFESEIMRATIVCQLINAKNNAGDTEILGIGVENYQKIYDIRDAAHDGAKDRATISKQQLIYLAEALKILYDGEDVFQVPVFNSPDDILAKAEYLDVLTRSDIVRYRICEYLYRCCEAISGLPPAISGSFDAEVGEEDAYDLQLLIQYKAHSASSEEIKSIAEKLQAYANYLNF